MVVLGEIAARDSPVFGLGTGVSRPYAGVPVYIRLNRRVTENRLSGMVHLPSKVGVIIELFGGLNSINRYVKKGYERHKS